MWRAPGGDVVRDQRRRITSTCVESTKPLRGAPRSLADHLHVRGEHGGGHHSALHPRGSPPRAWRALAARARGCGRVRITSTCVESTRRSACSIRRGPDHLHVRGEHVAVVPLHGLPDRITSTCVESTRPCRCGARWPSDHLHVRGEHADLRLWGLVNSGSPPRAWRARHASSSRPCAIRITSTCVESTFLRGPDPSRPTDHLHVRGEHAADVAVGADGAGSPPRAWRAPFATRVFTGAVVRFRSPAFGDRSAFRLLNGRC